MKKIIHIDMDCFFAAIEMRDNPRLQKVPLAIGGHSDERGVLCTCNYLARSFGLKSAMPTKTAKKLCPQLVVIPTNIKKYQEVSEEIMDVLEDFSDQIEPLSLDEAFLDVSQNHLYHGSATWTAREIKKRILQKTGLMASAGVAPNKFLAKIASDWNKPNGLFVIPPASVNEFVKTLQVGKLWGVGKVTEQRLHQMGIKNCADLQKIDERILHNAFGKMGYTLHQLSFGIDHRKIETDLPRKSLSVEHTFPCDLPELKSCLHHIPLIWQEFIRRFSQKNPRTYAKEISKLFVKIKFKDFKSVTVEKKQRQAFWTNLGQHNSTLLKTLGELITTAYHRKQIPVRLLGIGVRFSDKISIHQLPLPLDESICWS